LLRLNRDQRRYTEVIFAGESVLKKSPHHPPWGTHYTGEVQGSIPCASTIPLNFLSVPDRNKLPRFGKWRATGAGLVAGSLVSPSSKARNGFDVPSERLGVTDCLKRWSWRKGSPTTSV